MRTLFLLLFYLWFSYAASGQTFPVTPLMQNGPDSTRINLVMLSEGYTQAQLGKFLQDARDVMQKLFQNTPFKEYRDYFNVYAISVPSAESGASHPGTATDVTEPASPVATVNTYFNATFDYANIHRLLVARNAAAILQVLAANFPAYDQTLILVNSPVYGGAGGTFPTSSTHPSAAEISIHELGHSFSRLADEYWAGDVYASEKPNMTLVSDPDRVKWRNWLGVEQIGILPYGSSGLQSRWFKPTNRQCKMELLGRPFCAVCREAIINRIYQLVSPIADAQPRQATLPGSGADMTFSLSLIYPEPNTLQTTWTLNGQPLDSNTTLIQVRPDQLSLQNNVLAATVTDATSLSRSYLPAGGYVHIRRWTITQQATSTNEQPSAERFQFQCFPNPAEDLLFTRIFAEESAGNMTLSLLSLDGKTLHTRQIALLPGWQTIQTDVHALPAGAYLLHLRYAEWQNTLQWVKR